jgi:hypothetical protein
MTFEESYETLPGNGWLLKEEAELLWRSAMSCEGPILEVGCYQGRSTVLLAATGRTVYAVDPFTDFDNTVPGDKLYEILLKNLEERGIKNVQVFRLRIEDWEPIRHANFAYLDGDHSYNGTKEQIFAALWAGARVIAVHDVNDTGEGTEVKRAALELLGPWKERVERLAVWEVQRRNGLVEICGTMPS